MSKVVKIQVILAVFLWVQGCDKQIPALSAQSPSKQNQAAGKAPMDPNQEKITHTEAEWKKLLSPEQYNVLRRKGTERPFSGKYNTFNEDGVYKCGACGAVLFTSESKFDSHCGWPAFSAPIDPNAVAEKRDTSHGMIRTEVTCPGCGSHLGHVFDDGPGPTGLRYCINSAALNFQKKTDSNKPR